MGGEDETTIRAGVGRAISSRHQRPKSGLTLLELIISATILTIGLGGIVSTLLTSLALNVTNRESRLAKLAAESTIERIRGTTFSSVFATFNANPADDPGGAGTAPGSNFAVQGLAPQAGDPDGFAGEILYPGDGSALRENVVDLPLGMSRDLNGDGVVDAANHAGDYVVLPLRVRIRWRGKTGNRQTEYVTTLVNRQ
ncbi:MAG: prepilin-type N-terminal cleavage/methylation domain-containing protein [Planctomycetota bacterium]